MMNNKQEKINNITIGEYAAIYTYFNTLANIRMLSFSFFITAIGFVINSWKSEWWRPIFLLFFTFIIWGIELRNRALVTILKQRGLKIEESELLNGNLVEGTPFFHRMSYQSVDKKIKGFNDEIKVFGIVKKNLNISEKFNIGKDLFLFTHSFIFDTTFLITIIFCIISLIIILINYF